MSMKKKNLMITNNFEDERHYRRPYANLPSYLTHKSLSRWSCNLREVSSLRVSVYSLPCHVHNTP